MMPKVEQHHDWEAIEAAAAGSLDRSTRLSLFQRLSWFRLIADHAPPAGRLLALQSGRSWLFLSIDGRKAHAFANWYSLRFGAIGEDSAELQAIAAELRRHDVTRVQLYPMDGDDPLPAAFRRAGWWVDFRPATSNWSIDTQGVDFAAYWAARPSRLRNTAKRKTKAANLEIALHRAFDADAWAAYEAVFARSWKPNEGSMSFLKALAEQEGAAGTLRLGIARKDGEPIAAQLWLTENGTATIHKLAYAEEARDLSPGTILSVEMFREALDVDKVKRIDFGTGDDGYKVEWMDRSQPLYRLTAFNPKTLPGLAGAIRATASKLVRRARNH